MNSKAEEELISEKDLFIPVELVKSGLQYKPVSFWTEMGLSWKMGLFWKIILMVHPSYTNNKTEKKTFIEIIRENEPPMLRIQTYFALESTYS